jgi:hypothetical protein
MNEPIWTPAKRRFVIMATLFGIAVADGMLLTFEALKWLGNPQFASSYGLLTNWAEALAVLVLLPSFIFGGENPYFVNAILGAIAGAIIGLYISEFTNARSSPR